MPDQPQQNVNSPAYSQSEIAQAHADVVASQRDLTKIQNSGVYTFPNTVFTHLETARRSLRSQMRLSS